MDFKNTLLIMTSNVGASVIEKGGRNFGFFLRPDDEDQENVRGVPSCIACCSELQGARAVLELCVSGVTASCWNSRQGCLHY